MSALGMYVKRFVKSPWRYIAHPVRTLNIYKDLKSHRDTIALLNETFAENKETGGFYIKHGPFEGMRYPSHELTTGSSLWTVLLGSFEYAIQPIIKEALNKHYGTCINVGCAEGYYAIGFALKGNVDHVVGFDIDPVSRDYCNQMAKYNGVEVEVRDWCTSKVLKEYDFKGKNSIIISDCEGYEKELFTKDNIDNLRQSDILVEVHDFCQDETKILDYLTELFSETHNIELIRDIDDYDKAYTYDFEELKSLPILERKYVLQEGRYRLGEWLWMTPKNN